MLSKDFTMKHIYFIVIISTFSLAGFFNEQGAKEKAEYIENDRLCKIFTKKVADYKKHLRKDVLAAASLASYEYRAKLFCNKAQELNPAREEKKNISEDENQSSTSTDTNGTK